MFSILTYSYKTIANIVIYTIIFDMELFVPLFD